MIYDSEEELAVLFDFILEMTLRSVQSHGLQKVSVKIFMTLHLISFYSSFVLPKLEV